MTTGLDIPAGLALDLDGGKMYWADQATFKIQRADLDGSNVEDLVTTVSDAFSIALLNSETAPTVPEPATLTLFGFALAGLGLARRRWPLLCV